MVLLNNINKPIAPISWNSESEAYTITLDPTITARGNVQINIELCESQENVLLHCLFNQMRTKDAIDHY